MVHASPHIDEMLYLFWVERETVSLEPLWQTVSQTERASGDEPTNSAWMGFSKAFQLIWLSPVLCCVPLFLSFKLVCLFSANDFFSTSHLVVLRSV